MARLRSRTACRYSSLAPPSERSAYQLTKFGNTNRDYRLDLCGSIEDRIGAFEIATLAAMLLTNNNDAPRIIYVAMVMPLAAPFVMRFAQDRQGAWTYGAAINSSARR